MQRTLLLLGLLLSSLGAGAQITVTNSTFPSIGDTLRTRLDNLPSVDVKASQTGNLSWDFGSLSSPIELTQSYGDASTGAAFAAFPNANLITEIDAGQGYLVKTATELTLVGYAGADPLDLGLTVVTPFQPSQLLRKAPLSYQLSYNDTYSLLVAASAADLSEFLDDLGLPITPDSLRANISGAVSSVVDAYGNMSIPGGSFDVLRVKVTEIRNISVEAKVGFLGWSNVTALIANQLPVPTTDTITSFEFYSADAKEPIAVASMSDDGQVISVQYKSLGNVSSSQSMASLSQIDMTAFPNPAIDKTRIQFNGFPKGEYTFRLYNLLGSTLWEQPLSLQKNGQVLELPLDTLSRGMYLYSISDRQGKALITKRLIVNKP